MEVTYSEPNISTEGKRIDVLADGLASKLALFRPAGTKGSEAWMVLCGNQTHAGPLSIDKARYEAEHLLNDPEEYAAHAVAAEVMEKFVEPKLAEEPRTLEDGQMLLGKPEDGFTRPLCDTDERYIAAKRDSTYVGTRILSLREEIKEMKDEALEPIRDELKECTSRLDALEHLYAYHRICEALEEARIKSLEENATFVVCVISQKLTKIADWCFVCSKQDYHDKCSAWGTINVCKVREYVDGEVVSSRSKLTVTREEGAA